MRVSVWPTDAGYLAYCRGYRGCRVLLDGKEVKRVFTADEERGEVICADLNDDGQVYAVGDEIATRTLRGKVRITKP